WNHGWSLLPLAVSNLIIQVLGTVVIPLAWFPSYLPGPLANIKGGVLTGIITLVVVILVLAPCNFALIGYMKWLFRDQHTEYLRVVKGDGELGRYQNEIEAYKQAIRIKPDDTEAHNNLGVAYGGLGRYQDAIESFKQAIKIKPDYAEAHNNLGAAYFATGDKGSALEEYKILKTMDAEMANELFNLISQ
ncbi:MAG: tetratricopeptide repeat protein, partial [Planctomycetota bacterium]|nr:tetratricopeptide repeat protein [Planctomycetota bacterium]